MAYNDPDTAPDPVLILDMTATEMATRFRAATQCAVEEHLAAGRTVYGNYGTEQVYAIVPQCGEQGGSPTQAPSTTAPESRAS